MVLASAKTPPDMSIAGTQGVVSRVTQTQEGEIAKKVACVRSFLPKLSAAYVSNKPKPRSKEKIKPKKRRKH